jgi:ABC-2 type transport system permease protein
MKKYFRVYKKLFLMNLSVLTAHRAAFINHLVGGTVWGILSFIVALLLTYNVQSIFSWSKQEILLLTGILGVILGLFNTFFQANFDAFPNLVNKGKLDSFLLKPMDAQLLLSIWNTKIISLSRAIIGVVFIIYIYINYQLSFSWFGFILSLPIILLGLGLYYSIWLIVTTLTIWFDRATNIVELLHSLQGIMRIPPVAFRELNVTLFLIVLPLTIIAATPVGLFLGRFDLGGVALLSIVSLLCLFISRRFWLFALRSYTSASS